MRPQEDDDDDSIIMDAAGVGAARDESCFLKSMGREAGPRLVVVWGKRVCACVCVCPCAAATHTESGRVFALSDRALCEGEGGGTREEEGVAL